MFSVRWLCVFVHLLTGTYTVASLVALVLLAFILFRRRRHARNPARRRRATNPMTERAGLLRLNRNGHDRVNSGASRRASSLLFWDSDQYGAFSVEAPPVAPAATKRNSRDGELVRTNPGSPTSEAGSPRIGSGSSGPDGIWGTGNTSTVGYSVNIAGGGKDPNYGTVGSRPGTSTTPFPRSARRLSGTPRAY
jgi:hypothetical protein